MKSFARFVVAGLLSLTFGFANAAVIYFSDELGKVGKYDDATLTVSPVGNLSASFSVGQVIGIAWDANNSRILLLDRDAPAVYAMNPTSGATTLLFNPGFSFQGGAVVGSILYGIDEGTQTVEAFNLTTFANQNLSAATLSQHTHGAGVNPATGQLYLGGGPVIFTASAAGVEGSTVVTDNLNHEDVDYYGGDFLVATYDANLSRVNGTTGIVTEFLSAAQVTAGGLTGNVSGVAVAGAAVAHTVTTVPTLDAWGMLLLSLFLAGSGFWFTRRSRG